MVCPKFETKFLGKLWNSNVFSAQKQVVFKKNKIKKKSSPKLSLIFRPKSEIQTIFPLKNKWSPKKKKKKRSSPNMSLIFRTKSEIQTLFHTESRHLLHNFGTQYPLEGTVFNFSPKIGPKKQQKRAILHTSQANGGARAPPWLRYCVQCRPT